MNWHTITQSVLEGVVASAAVAAAPLIVGWLARQLQRAGLQVTAEQQARLEYLTKQAILKAEELIAAHVKAGQPATAGDKLVIATGSLMQSAGVDSITAANSIHAVLPTMGLGATASPLAPGAHQ